MDNISPLLLSFETSLKTKLRTSYCSYYTEEKTDHQEGILRSPAYGLWSFYYMDHLSICRPSVGHRKTQLQAPSLSLLFLPPAVLSHSESYRLSDGRQLHQRWPLIGLFLYLSWVWGRLRGNSSSFPLKEVLELAR